MRMMRPSTIEFSFRSIVATAIDWLDASDMAAATSWSSSSTSYKSRSKLRLTINRLSSWTRPMTWAARGREALRNTAPRRARKEIGHGKGLFSSGPATAMALFGADKVAHQYIIVRLARQLRVGVGFRVLG